MDEKAPNYPSVEMIHYLGPEEAEEIEGFLCRGPSGPVRYLPDVVEYLSEHKGFGSMTAAPVISILRRAGWFVT